VNVVKATGHGQIHWMRRSLAYILPTVYLLVIFTAFQAISISTMQRDRSGGISGAPMFVYAATLPWSILSPRFSGSLYYLPMVAGAALNAGILYLILRKR
jgi:hypothetical protein